jgi:transposase
MTVAAELERKPLRNYGAPPDNGCHLHPKCLECPEPRCIEDVSLPLAVTRAGRVAALVKEGLTSRQIAERLHYSVQVVEQHRRRWKAGKPSYKIFTEEDVKLITFWAGKISRAEIARMLGVAPVTLNRFTARAGLNLKKASRHTCVRLTIGKPGEDSRAGGTSLPGGRGAASPSPAQKNE